MFYSFLNSQNLIKCPVYKVIPNSYYMAGTGLGTRDREVKKIHTSPSQNFMEGGYRILAV